MIESIPYEIWFEILRNLQFIHILQMARVNKKLYKITNDDKLWKIFLNWMGWKKVRNIWSQIISLLKLAKVDSQSAKQAFFNALKNRYPPSHYYLQQPDPKPQSLLSWIWTFFSKQPTPSPPELPNSEKTSIKTVVVGEAGVGKTCLVYLHEICCSISWDFWSLYLLKWSISLKCNMLDQGTLLGEWRTRCPL